MKSEPLRGFLKSSSFQNSRRIFGRQGKPMREKKIGFFFLPTSAKIRADEGGPGVGRTEEPFGSFSLRQGGSGAFPNRPRSLRLMQLSRIRFFSVNRRPNFFGEGGQKWRS